ncbi:LD-carboxypeptidase [Apibacter muscae]|uniref:S66 peptidase family protein n=1 Tax=Apibacter muscae TaxID=2509004 RepID=UPI0011AC807B|nr:LD-carboxypeptidase [Apibacter muscae]TWP22916.1 LD-carboxypeptidase [Apibacter muscae]
MHSLKKNDKILIVAPAGAVTKEHIQPAIKIIEDHGWKYEIGKNTFNSYSFGYNYSGKPKERLNDLQWALDHPEAKAIWFARGGYGAVQIVDLLNLNKFIKHPKWLIGYSDNTVFHQHFNRRGFPTLHATVCKPLADGHSDETFTSLINALQKNKLNYSFNVHPLNKGNSLEGTVTGGNLSILYSLIGSNSLDLFDDKILFIEDWYENFYHIDRILISLKRAGVLNKVKGFLIGGFTRMDSKEDNINYNNPFDNEAYLVIDERLKSFDVPKIYGFPAGHIHDCRAIIMNGKISIKIENNKILFSNSIS